MGINIKIDIDSNKFDALVNFSKLLSNFEDGTITEEDQKKCPTFGDKKLSFIRGDTNSYVVTRDDKIFVKCEKLFLKDIKLESHILAMYIYILQNFSYNKKSLYEVLSTSRDLSANLDPNVKRFVSGVCQTLYEFQMKANTSHLANMFTYILDDFEVSVPDKLIVEKLVSMIQNILDYNPSDEKSSLDNFTVGEFFEMETIFGKWTRSIYGLIFMDATIEGYKPDKSVIMRVKNKLLSFMNATFANEPITLETMAEILLKYNPINCDIIREDLVTLTSFKDFSFSEIHQIVDISYGHCYTYDYIAKMLIMKNGFLILSSPISDKQVLGQNLGRYYSKHKKSFNEFLKDDIIALKLSGLSTDLTNFKTIIETTEPNKEQLIQFFVYMLTEYNVNLSTAVVERMMLEGGSSLMDLIGLLGYICYSDDIYNGEANENAEHFEKSSYCIQMFRSLITEPELNYITINNISLTNIINSTECIHGIGAKLLDFYMLCYSYVQRVFYTIDFDIFVNKDADTGKFDIDKLGCGFTKKLLNKMGIDEQKYTGDEIMSMIKSNFQLAPYVLELPIAMSSTGYSYMTIVRDDVVIQDHPLLNRYVVTVSNGLSSKQTTVIDCTNTFGIPEVQISSLNYMVPIGTYTIESIDNDIVCTQITNMIIGNSEMLTNLMRISYTFQRNRCLRFLLFSEYTKNMINVLKMPSNTDKEIDKDADKYKNKYEQIHAISRQPVFDMINLEDTMLPLHKLAIIDLSTKSNGHMYGNTQIEKFDMTNYYVDTLENIINMQYQPAKKEQPGPPGVFLSYRGGNNIVRQYEYSKVLSTMLYRNVYMSNVHVFPLRDTDNSYYLHNKNTFSLFENYILNLYGQSSMLRSRIFKDIKFQFVYNANTTITLSPKDISNYLEILKTSLLSPEQTDNHESIYDMIGLIMKHFGQLELTNASIIVKELTIVGDLLQNYLNDDKLKNIFTGLTNLINDILARMRFFMYMTIVHYSIIMPINDFSYTGLWNIPIVSTGENLDSIWLKQYSLEIAKNRGYRFTIELHNKYQLVIRDLINIVCNYGSMPNTCQYHFTEINKDIHLIKYIDSKISLTSDFRTTKSNAYKEIKDTISYYKDYDKTESPSVLQLKAEDGAEGQREIFDYLAKIDIMKQHELRMNQYINFENILCNIYDNVLSTYLVDLDSLASFDFNGADDLHKEYFQYLLKHHKQIDYISLAYQVVLNTGYSATGFLLLQDFYIGCLYHKQKIDTENKTMIENKNKLKQEVFTNVKDILAMINSMDSDDTVLSEKAATLDAAIFTGYNSDNPERRQQISDAKNNLALLSSKAKEYKTKLCRSKPKLFEKRIIRYNATYSMFDYTLKWIQSIDIMKDFEIQVKSLIAMIQTATNAINNRIEIESTPKAGAEANAQKN